MINNAGLAIFHVQNFYSIRRRKRPDFGLVFEEEKAVSNFIALRITIRQVRITPIDQAQQFHATSWLPLKSLVYIAFGWTVMRLPWFTIITCPADLSRCVGTTHPSMNNNDRINARLQAKAPYSIRFSTANTHKKTGNITAQSLDRTQ